MNALPNKKIWGKQKVKLCILVYGELAYLRPTSILSTLQSPSPPWPTLEK